MKNPANKSDALDALRGLVTKYDALLLDFDRITLELKKVEPIDVDSGLSCIKLMKKKLNIYNKISLLVGHVQRIFKVYFPYISKRDQLNDLLNVKSKYYGMVSSRSLG